MLTMRLEAKILKQMREYRMHLTSCDLAFAVYITFVLSSLHVVFCYLWCFCLVVLCDVTCNMLLVTSNVCCLLLAYCFAYMSDDVSDLWFVICELLAYSRYSD